ncbi:28S ribosomal protein S23, mitochondrial-like [Portunus trituberculatus]|uniref:28S ribosomal protein S23, mitochondrial-like n=1 Tax=Portunus trituberculatus TaxID=210409 RepID=UPI001E1CC9E6|nr:28S ribosomal protein S23, mitochondrial-like [Portunus trituberculatus]XP_045133095.1 28S ribosomal protein S23, mitochondrial-like [Portunus trituberculatus]XP_045133096.1 28S ribosomal protein S23, mitochondrial-like [Portunus trituberculatus]
MAGSRLEKIGTIFTRATGLLKSGAVKPQDKPLWYDVYEAFPPRYEPHYDRSHIRKEIKQIFYPEDVIRGKFYRKYGSPGIINLSETNARSSLCQLFVAEYKHLEADSTLTEDRLMEEAALALETSGFYLDHFQHPQKADVRLHVIFS